MKRSEFLERYIDASAFGDRRACATVIADAMGLTDEEPTVQCDFAEDYPERLRIATQGLLNDLRADRDAARAELAALRAAVLAWDRVLTAEDYVATHTEMLRLARGEK